MNKFLTFAFFAIAAETFAGVSIGGGSGSSKALTDLASTAFSVESLPTVDVDADVLRRTEARLAVSGTENVDLSLDGSSFEVRKINKSVVDVQMTRRFLSLKLPKVEAGDFR